MNVSINSQWYLITSIIRKEDTSVQARFHKVVGGCGKPGLVCGAGIV
jgi:hypothetical protein